MPGDDKIKREVAGQVFDKPPAASVTEGKNFLLLIAIDHYAQAQLNLNNPVYDANRLLRALCQSYHFAPENANSYTDLTKTDPRYNDRSKYWLPILVYDDKYIQCLYNEQATPANINAKINFLKANMSKDDNLLVYFAGHGYWDKDADLWYFVHHHYNILEPNGLPFLETANRAGKMEGKPFGKNLLFILDSCFSGNVLKGLVGQMDESYGQMVLTSTGGKELAADGRIREGSPFSTALIKVLNTNTRKVIDVRDLYTELKKEFNELDQHLQMGVVPGTLGSDCFSFMKKRSPGNADSFAESILKDLNFTDERGIIDTEINTNLNTEYIVLSSVSNENRYHKLMSGVCSRALLDKVNLREAPKTVINIECKEDDIWITIARKFNLPTTDADIQDSVLDALTDQLMIDFIRIDATPESIAPYFMGLSFENLTPQLTSSIKSFCEKLLVGLNLKREAQKKEGVKYSPLFLFIYDVRSGLNLFSRGNLEVAPAACDKKCSPFILFHSEKESNLTIKQGQAEKWFKASAESLKSLGFFKLEENWVAQQFINKETMSMIDFILAAAEATGLKLSEITQILFKTN